MMGSLDSSKQYLFAPAVLLVACLAAAELLPATPGETPDDPPRSAGEYDVKAAFLYNFAKFIDWPPEAFPGPDSPFVFGILGEDPYRGALESIVANKRIRGRPLSLRRFGSAEELEPCHVLFVSKSESARWESSIRPRLEGRSVLTVSEFEGFAGRGGVINFYLENNHVRFEINTEAARRSELQVSSQLLKLASVVERGSEESVR